MITRSLTNAARCLVLYVDSGVIVISKPPGLTSQATTTPRAKYNNPDSLDDTFDELTQMLRLETRPLSVHRLDKGTTGALLLARSRHIARDLSHQFHSRTVQKTYLALVRAGRETFTTDTGSINAQLRIDDGRVSVSDKEGGGVDALTEWQVVASSTMAPLSLLRLTLHTGVKHQLRVHLANILKAPILGDTLYSHSCISEKIRNVVSVPENRLFLHASRISFFRYGKTLPKRFNVGVTAPLPEDFVHVSAQLGFMPDAHEIDGGVTLDGKPAPF